MSRAHKMTTSKVINDYLQNKHIQVLKMWIKELQQSFLSTSNYRERIAILKQIAEFRGELKRVAS